MICVMPAAGKKQYLQCSHSDDMPTQPYPDVVGHPRADGTDWGDLSTEGINYLRALRDFGGCAKKGKRTYNKGRVEPKAYPSERRSRKHHAVNLPKSTTSLPKALGILLACCFCPTGPLAMDINVPSTTRANCKLLSDGEKYKAGTGGRPRS